MDQHIISAWMLRAFARHAGGSHVLHVYDKQLDVYVDVSVDDFLAETDAHSTAVEEGLGRIEGPAAEAARALAKRAKLLLPGLYAIVGPNDEARTTGPAFSDHGMVGDMRLMVSEHQIASPSERERIALATYAALMYQRAPKVEAALIEFGEVYDQAAQAALNQLRPGMVSNLPGDTTERRTRMLESAENIGAELARANWWIVRAGKGEAFVLGDNPVTTTISLGHDDSWRPILSEATYVVAMPLGPNVALVIAPQTIIPVTGIERDVEAVGAVNRLVWRSADRFVLARDRDQLDAALPDGGELVRRATIPVDFGAERVARTATGNVIDIVARVLWRHSVGPWQRWERCLLTFGYVPWAAEDRDLIMGSAHPPTTPSRGDG